MIEPTEDERMKAFEARLHSAKTARVPDKPHQEEHYSQAQMGWRMVSELVAGLLIGVGAGYGLDALFGTIPLFLVTFTLLGFVAGVRVMLRTAQEFQADRQDAAAAKAPDRGA